MAIVDLGDLNLKGFKIDTVELEKQYWNLMMLLNADPDKNPEWLVGLLDFLAEMKDQVYPDMETIWSPKFQRSRIDELRSTDNNVLTYLPVEDNEFADRVEKVEVVGELANWKKREHGALNEDVMYRIKFSDGQTTEVHAYELVEARYADRVDFTVEHCGLTVPLTAHDLEQARLAQLVLCNRVEKQDVNLIEAGQDAYEALGEQEAGRNVVDRDDFGRE